MNQPKNPVNLQVKLDEEMAEGTFVNILHVFHNGHEFVLDFGRVIPGKQEAKIKSRLVTTPAQFKDMVRVLNQNLGMFEKAFGEIQGPQPPASQSGDDSVH